MCDRGYSSEGSNSFNFGNDHNRGSYKYESRNNYGRPTGQQGTSVNNVAQNYGLRKRYAGNNRGPYNYGNGDNNDRYNNKLAYRNERRTQNDINKSVVQQTNGNLHPAQPINNKLESTRLSKFFDYQGYESPNKANMFLHPIRNFEPINKDNNRQRKRSGQDVNIETNTIIRNDPSFVNPFKDSGINSQATIPTPSPVYQASTATSKEITDAGAKVTASIIDFYPMNKSITINRPFIPQPVTSATSATTLESSQKMVTATIIDYGMMNNNPVSNTGPVLNSQPSRRPKRELKQTADFNKQALIPSDSEVNVRANVPNTGSSKTLRGKSIPVIIKSIVVVEPISVSIPAGISPCTANAAHSLCSAPQQQKPRPLNYYRTILFNLTICIE